MAIESGAARSTAPNDVTIVPTMNGCHAAKFSATGSQPLAQMKLSPNSWIAGHAPVKTFQTIAAIVVSARIAAAAVRP